MLTANGNARGTQRLRNFFIRACHSRVIAGCIAHARSWIENHVAQEDIMVSLANTLTISALVLIHGYSRRPQTSLQPVQIYQSGAEEERAETARLVSE